MLWGQQIKVYTDHKNLVRDALGLTCDRVYHWRLLLEEYDPEIVYIKGTDNIVADAVSRLDYDETINTRNLNVHLSSKVVVKVLNGYVKKTTSSKAFQTDEKCVPMSTRTFEIPLETARANSSSIRDITNTPDKRSENAGVNDKQVEHHMK